MEKVRREIKLFFTRNGKSLLIIIGFIAVVILSIQTLNQYAKEKDDGETSKISYEQIEEKQLQWENQEKDKNIIYTFIEYCNNKNITKAYEMLSDECKQKKYVTIVEFEEKYLNKVFRDKKDCEITFIEDNLYKITFLKDLLQAGTIENREDLEDYYSIQEDVLGNKTININFRNNI